MAHLREAALEREARKLQQEESKEEKEEVEEEEDWGDSDEWDEAICGGEDDNYNNMVDAELEKKRDLESRMSKETISYYVEGAKNATVMAIAGEFNNWVP